MADVIFPKRVPNPRELDTRPIPNDYRPRQLRAPSAGTEDESYFGDEPSGQDYAGGSIEMQSVDIRGMELPGQISLRKLEEDLNRNRLNEIASLVRTLTYGEMIEFAQAIWKIRPEGDIDENSLPMILHLWSTSTSSEQ